MAGQALARAVQMMVAANPALPAALAVAEEDSSAAIPANEIGRPRRPRTEGHSTRVDHGTYEQIPMWKHREESRHAEFLHAFFWFILGLVAYHLWLRW
jgi:hypothetical protein